ncbi:MAG: pyrroloquinoline quinone precursor peptide PqqA [Acidobacteriaceae bacterium]|nr:pyrroloquinoline quinone precursor peptide PqqA [Acidobacteriaceae bacterium]
MREGATQMQWSTPSFEEVCLSCEIASYANPEI